MKPLIALFLLCLAPVSMSMVSETVDYAFAFGTPASFKAAVRCAIAARDRTEHWTELRPAVLSKNRAMLIFEVVTHGTAGVTLFFGAHNTIDYNRRASLKPADLQAGLQREINRFISTVPQNR